MERETKSWKNTVGKLELDSENSTWSFTSSKREKVISINSWRITEKGYMTEIFLEDSVWKQEIIIEMIEKNFNDEIFLPENPDETADKIMELCGSLLSIDTTHTAYNMASSLYNCLEKLFTEPFLRNVKCMHVYYGNGLFFGVKRIQHNKVKRIGCIPKRCMEFLGTRLDSIAD